MAKIDTLLNALDERSLAQYVGIGHDEARMHYSLRYNTIRTFDEFSDLIGDYYNHHFSRCVARGGSLSTAEAVSRAKQILEKEYRKRHGDISAAFNNAYDGTNGGMRAILDLLAEGIKAEAVENYIREVFDRLVAPNSWEDKVQIVSEFINRCGGLIASSIRADQPERYAQNYNDLIRSYVDALQQTSSMFRRL